MQGLENELREGKEMILLKEAEVAKLKANNDKTVKALQVNLSKLQGQLASMSDYEDLKKELTIIKDIEFVGVSPTTKSLTIEQLLAQKNKKLDTELTTLKNKFEENESHSRTLESDLSTFKKKVEEQSVLVAKLENDLTRMNQAPPPPRPTHVNYFSETFKKQKFSNESHSRDLKNLLPEASLVMQLQLSLMVTRHQDRPSQI